MRELFKLLCGKQAASESGGGGMAAGAAAGAAGDGGASASSEGPGELGWLGGRPQGLVVHNGVLDLMFLYEAFWRPLPTTLSGAEPVRTWAPVLACRWPPRSCLLPLPPRLVLVLVQCWCWRWCWCYWYCWC
jgi:hypothetical protein